MTRSKKKLEFVVVELLHVVRDDNLWNPKSTNDVFPNKIPGVLLGDFGERHYLYPLREIVYGDNQKLHLQCGLR